jgi:hypothetical protein
MPMKSRRKLWQAGFLAVALIAGCGGSSSRHDPNARRPSATGGSMAGENATAGNGAVPASGGVGAGTGGTTGDAGSPDVGGSGGNAGSSPAGGSAGNAGSPASGGTSGSAGSQPTGGSAGAGGALVLPLPPGCQPRTPMETAELCSLAVDCDAAASVRSYCHRLETGEWECQCANHEYLYRLTDASGLDACALAAGLCSNTEPELGEESCEPISNESDQASCSIEVACGRPIAIDVTTDALATRMRFGSVRCNGSDSGQSFRCTCENGETSSYGLLADSSEVACEPFADFCMSRETPVFDGEEACSLTYATTDSERCQRAAGCGPQMPLSEEVSLLQPVDRYATCVPRSGGGSECYCSQQDIVFEFHLSTPPDDASCEASIPNCDPNAVIEPTGPPVCEPLSPDPESEDTCGGYLTCLQPATVDDRSIEARGLVHLRCGRTELGMPWFCSCASGPDTARFEVGAPNADAAEACNQGSTTCLEEIDMHLGLYDDTVIAPDPL